MATVIMTTERTIIFMTIERSELSVIVGGGVFHPSSTVRSLFLVEYAEATDVRSLLLSC